jgi:hypothetical protein
VLLDRTLIARLAALPPAAESGGRP